MKELIDGASDSVELVQLTTKGSILETRRFWNSLGHAISNVCEGYADALKGEFEALVAKEGAGEGDAQEVLRLLLAEREARSKAETLGHGGFDRAALNYGIAVLEAEGVLDELDDSRTLGFDHRYPCPWVTDERREVSSESE